MTISKVEQDSREAPGATRRKLLRHGGILAGGAAVLGTLFAKTAATPAMATTGDALTLGDTGPTAGGRNLAEDPTTLIYDGTAAPGTILVVEDADFPPGQTLYPAAIGGWAGGTAPGVRAGIYGWSGVRLGAGIGVVGKAVSGIGVLGVEDSGGVGVYGSSNTGLGVYGESNDFAGYFTGRVYVSGMLTKGGGGFKIDHPLDPANKYLVHSFVESPEMLNVYSGSVTTDGSGEAVVSLPNYFDTVNRDVRYQLTVVGQFAQAIVSSKVEQNRFTIKTDKPNVEVCWQVTGVRKDPFAEAHRLLPEEPKSSDERGKYLHPELHGQAATSRIGYRADVHVADTDRPPMPSVAPPARQVAPPSKLTPPASQRRSAP